LGRKKNWRARKAGRAARKKLLEGDMVFVWCFFFSWFGLDWVSAVRVVARRR
jgi:hypothetical protein